MYSRRGSNRPRAWRPPIADSNAPTPGKMRVYAFGQDLDRLQHINRALLTVALWKSAASFIHSNSCPRDLSELARDWTLPAP